MTKNFKPARDENDQPRAALIAAHQALVERGDLTNAEHVASVLRQKTDDGDGLLTDEMAMAIHG